MASPTDLALSPIKLRPHGSGSSLRLMAGQVCHSCRAGIRLTKGQCRRPCLVLGLFLIAEELPHPSHALRYGNCAGFPKQHRTFCNCSHIRLLWPLLRHLFPDYPKPQGGPPHTVQRGCRSYVIEQAISHPRGCRLSLSHWPRFFL